MASTSTIINNTSITPFIPEARVTLTTQQRKDARDIFEGRIDGITSCHYCGGIHARVANLIAMMQPCPRIASIERHTDGTVLKLTFWPNGEWEQGVIFPDDVYVDDDEDG